MNRRDIKPENIMKRNIPIIALAALALVVTLGIFAPVFAQTATPPPTGDPLADLDALRAAYDALRASHDPALTMLLWAGLLAGGLKLALSVFMRLVYKETKSWTRWVALGAAVPIALLSHYALGNNWFASLVYAGAGPGAIIVHELLAAVAKPKATGMLAALLVGVALVAGPGCTHDTRRDTIHAALVATDSARAGFVAWDREHQLDLVERATTREGGAAALAEYRGKRDGLTEKLVGVYRAIAAASLANDDQSLASLLAAADQLHEALSALTGGKIP